MVVARNISLTVAWPKNLKRKHHHWQQGLFRRVLPLCWTDLEINDDLQARVSRGLCGVKDVVRAAARAPHAYTYPHSTGRGNAAAALRASAGWAVMDYGTLLCKGT